MIEFHTDPFTGEAMYRVVGEQVIRELTPKDTEAIQELLENSKTFYPEQFAALNEEYAKSSLNKRHFDFFKSQEDC